MDAGLAPAARTQTRCCRGPSPSLSLPSFQAVGPRGTGWGATAYGVGKSSCLMSGKQRCPRAGDPTQPPEEAWAVDSVGRKPPGSSPSPCADRRMALCRPGRRPTGDLLGDMEQVAWAGLCAPAAPGLQAGGGAVQPSPSPSPPLRETGPRASRRASGLGSLPAVPLAPTPLQGAASPAPPTGPSAWLKGHPVSLTPGVSVGVGGACPALPSSVNQTRPTKPHCSPQQDPAPWPWGYSPHFGGQRGGRGGGRKQRQRAIYAASPRKFIFNCLLTASGGEGRPGWRCRCRAADNPLMWLLI